MKTNKYCLEDLKGSRIGLFNFYLHFPLLKRNDKGHWKYRTLTDGGPLVGLSWSAKTDGLFSPTTITSYSLSSSQTGLFWTVTKILKKKIINTSEKRNWKQNWKSCIKHLYNSVYQDENSTKSINILLQEGTSWQNPLPLKRFSKSKIFMYLLEFHPDVQIFFSFFLHKNMYRFSLCCWIWNLHRLKLKLHGIFCTAWKICKGLFKFTKFEDFLW